MKPTHDLHLDFETYCDLNLKKVGVYNYVKHHSFHVLCVAWKIDGGATSRSILSIPAQALPETLKHALASPDYQGHAFNAAFETAVLDRLRIAVANPLICTMQRALAYGLPGKLEMAGAALGLAHQKDMAGHRLMMRMSQPAKAGGPVVSAPAWTGADYQALADYCAKDVEAEAALSDVIPMLIPEEWELSKLDARMNRSGELGIDMNRVCTLEVMGNLAEKVDAARCATLTGGAVTSPGTQTARLLTWLASRGCTLPDTQRATIEQALGEAQTGPDVFEVLAIRLRTARASTNKLAAMVNMADRHDHSLRGQFQFCGAGRTGRWSGRGVQVQNLPRRPKDGFDPQAFYDATLRAVCDNHDAETLGRVTPYPVLDCVSYSLRSCFKATDNTRLMWSFDFSQIEARVLAWLAGQNDILAVFASGDDVYVWAARQFGSPDRQLGKVLVLALGYGMGATKLRDTALKSYSVRMTPSQADSFKSGWRQTNSRIVQFWYDMENAAKQAVLNRGRVYAVGGSGVAFVSTAKTMQMRLPSGRVLYYHKPRLDQATGSIVYWGPEVGNRWVEQRTWGGKLAENATQAAARDIMSEAMLRAFRRQQRVPCMTVHDELVYTVPHKPETRELTDLLDLMLELPPWAGGLPVAGECKLMERYGVKLP